MRVLVTFVGGSGHLLPLLPVARAARARGHAVAVSGQHAMAEAVARTGFPFLPSGGRTLAPHTTRSPLRPVDGAAEERTLREAFAGRVARERAAALLQVAQQWQPDLVVHDEVDLGAAVAAERLGLVRASVVVLAAGGFLRPDVVAEPLAALRAAHGLPPEPSSERALVIAPLPPSFRDPRFPLPLGTVHVRPAELEPRDEPVVGSLGEPPRTQRDGPVLRSARRPCVYVTLGTVFPQESGDLLRRTVAALAALDVDLIVTTGPALAPEELGPQRDGVRIERLVPQVELLPHCDAVVCHAGSGSVVGALAVGLPLVLLPIGADQPHNADRCAALGVGRVVDPLTVSASDLRGAVLDVLHSPGPRAAAERLRDECAALLTADDVVQLLEQLLRP